MKSDVIHVTSTGAGMQEALDQTERVAAFKGLSAKDAMRLRLLAEEMMGMVRALTGQREAVFWIEDENRNFQLHLKTETLVDVVMREKLLKASTSGKNSAAKGLMGKIRDLFEAALAADPSRGIDPMMTTGMTGSMSGMSVKMATAGIWSFTRYKGALSEENRPQEDWDELEHSIVANIADEIQICIKETVVEMIIFKKFQD